MSKGRMIIDTDCGVDDALAILLALSQNETWDVVAITCCAGNTTLDNVCSNVFRLTNYCNRKQIPVYRGCSKSLLNDVVPSHRSFHGEDGLGDVSHQFSTGDQEVCPESAPSALTRLASENKGQITLVALGPLTNVAMAKRLDDQFDRNLKELFVMGGNVDGLGNATASAEFNFAFDPEAAYIVTNDFECPLKIFPWETCLRHFMSWDFYEQWTSQEHPVSKICGQITASCIKYIKENRLRDGYHSPDLFAMACFLKPSAVKASLNDCPVSVEVGGRSSRGLMVVDRRALNRRGKAKGNVEIITQVNLDQVYELFMSMMPKK